MDHEWDRRYAYTAYGLNIESQLPLPGLVRRRDGRSDVTIRFGGVPPSLSTPFGPTGTWQAEPNRLLVRAARVARYLVSDGREIRIERGHDGTDDDVRTFLLSSAMAAVLHQRNILALHASAIRTGRGAVLFMGRSGCGRSTLLTALVGRGYAMLADDISGVVTDGEPRVVPAVPMTHLWPDAAARLRQTVNESDRQRASVDKYAVPVKRFCGAPVALCAVYVLRPHNRPDLSIGPLGPVQGVAALTRYTYRKKSMWAMGLGRQHFAAVTTVARAAALRLVTRPTFPFLIDRLADLIEEDLR